MTPPNATSASAPIRPGSPGWKHSLTLLDRLSDSGCDDPNPGPNGGTGSYEEETPVNRYRIGAVVAAVVAAGVLPGIAIVASNASAATVAAPAVQPVPSTCSDLKPIRLAADHWMSGHSSSTPNTWFTALFIKGDIETFRMTGDS